MKIFICAHPSDTREATESGFPLCHLAYRFGKDGRLYRGGLGVSARGGMLAISDSGLGENTVFDPEVLHDIKAECNARGFEGVVCDFERGAGIFTTRFVYEASAFFKSGIKLFVPEAFASASGTAQIMVSSSVVGGSCEEHYRRAAMRYGERAALVYDPVYIDFVMPAPSGASDFISAAELHEIYKRESVVSYFSRELCANYFTYRDGSGKSRFAMFDDERSMLRKLMVARQCGFTAAFVTYPDAHGCLDELK